MARRFGFKPTLRQQQLANLAASRFYAGAAPAEKMAAVAERIEKMEANVKPKRERARRSIDPTESEILRAILDYLRQHPKCAFVGRFNRGVAQGSYNGRESYVRFNTIRGFPDLHGCLKGGRALYVEVKRPGKNATEDQADFIAQATKAGALAFVATSIDDVEAALK